MLTNVEKRYQLGSSDTDIENGTTPIAIVGVKRDWKVWTISSTTLVPQFLMEYLELDSRTHY